MSLAELARTAVSRSPAWSATNGRVGSTFVNGAIRGGAVWLWQEPAAEGGAEGRTYVMRVSPRRVLLDLQIAAGATPDARYGLQTRHALLRLTGAPEGTSDANLILTSLQRVYHGGRGIVWTPERVEFPSSAHPVEVRGDETYMDAVDLATDRTTPVPRTAGTEHAADEIHRADAALEQPRAASTPSAQPSTPPGLTQAQRDAMGLATTPRGDTAPVPAPDLVVRDLRVVPDASAALVAPQVARAGLAGWMRANPGKTAVFGVALIGAGALAMNAARK